MLGYLVLIALQIIAAWFGKGHVTGYIPNQGAIIDAAVEAAVIAVIGWVVGLVGSFVLKDVRTPGSSTHCQMASRRALSQSLALSLVIYSAVKRWSREKKQREQLPRAVHLF